MKINCVCLQVNPCRTSLTSEYRSTSEDPTWSKGACKHTYFLFDMNIKGTQHNDILISWLVWAVKNKALASFKGRSAWWSSSASLFIGKSSVLFRLSLWPEKLRNISAIYSGVADKKVVGLERYKSKSSVYNKTSCLTLWWWLKWASSYDIEVLEYCLLKQRLQVIGIMIKSRRCN